MTRDSLVGGALVAGLCAAAVVVAPLAGADERGNGYNGAPIMNSGAPIPVMNGVPCVGGNFGTCVAFAQNQPPRGRPGSTVSHSPTVGP